MEVLVKCINFLAQSTNNCLLCQQSNFGVYPQDNLVQYNLGRLLAKTKLIVLNVEPWILFVRTAFV